MKRSHTPPPGATRSTRAPSDAQLDPQVAAAEAAEQPPRTSEGPVPAWAPEAEPSGLSPLRWDDPLDTRAWLHQVRLAFEDLAALSREGARRLKDRTLSRAEIEREVSEAEHKLRALLVAADDGLAPLPAEKGGRGV
jgi:hypothetical protein